MCSLRFWFSRGEHRFEAPLQPFSCPECAASVWIGGPHCASHQPCPLFIAQSSIPGAGLGVFASRHIAAGTVLGMYIGEVISAAELDDRYTRKGFAPYVLSAAGTRYVDCALRRCMMSMINHQPLSRANAKFQESSVSSRWPTVVTTRDIAAGEEVFVHYGNWFRFSSALKRAQTHGTMCLLCPDECASAWTVETRDNRSAALKQKKY